jgi:hypothetical protein
MHMDLETILALHSMRQQLQTMGEDDLVGEPEEETCATCGGLMFEDAREPFALYCPDCDLVPR